MAPPPWINVPKISSEENHFNTLTVACFDRVTTGFFTAIVLGDLAGPPAASRELPAPRFRFNALRIGVEGVAAPRARKLREGVAPSRGFEADLRLCC